MTPASLSVTELRELPEQGRPVTVVDIRAAHDREWTIPGSIQVDALDAVKSGMLGLLADLSLDSEPIVTVCAAGATAALANHAQIIALNEPGSGPKTRSSWRRVPTAAP